MPEKILEKKDLKELMKKHPNILILGKKRKEKKIFGCTFKCILSQLVKQEEQPLQNSTLNFLKVKGDRSGRSAICAKVAANQNTLTSITEIITELTDGVRQRSTLETQHLNQIDVGNYV